MKEGIESIGKFVVPGSDTTKLLESIEEALDQMTSLVPMPVDRTFIFPIATGRNIGKRTGRLDGFDAFQRTHLLRQRFPIRYFLSIGSEGANVGRIDQDLLEVFLKKIR